MKIMIDVDNALHARLRDAAEGGDLSVEELALVLVARGMRDAYGDPLRDENRALRALIADARADLLEHTDDGACAGPHGDARRGACSACRIAEALGVGTARAASMAANLAFSAAPSLAQAYEEACAEFDAIKAKRDGSGAEADCSPPPGLVAEMTAGLGGDLSENAE
jgi:hypothetical protein